MTEYVVTLRNGQRHELEADRYDRRALADASTHHEFSTPPDPPRHWPEEQVVLVQRRNGHLLEQVWPAISGIYEAPIHEVEPESYMLPPDTLVQDEPDA